MTLRVGDFRRKYPIGHTVGKGFTDNGFPQGVHVGILTRIDELSLKGDVKVLTRGGQLAREVDLMQGMAGPRSFWGGVPEVNSLVMLVYRMQHKQVWKPVIVGYLPVGNKSGLRFDPFSPTDPKDIPTDPAEKSIYDQFIGRTIRYKRLRLKPGQVGGMSSDGAEFVLSKDVRFTNRAGDLVELRDAERTLVTQAVHRFDSASGVKHYSGPVRRSEQFLPRDIFASGRQLKGESDRYFGQDELKALGPGVPGATTKYANSSGVVQDFFNDTTTYPPTTYSNGKRVFYPSTVFGTSIEDGEAGGGVAFTEERTELAHDSDLVQEVLNEIDGFSVTKRRPYIEHVLGTVVGNDATTSQGMRAYGKVLRPEIWSTFEAGGPGKFLMNEVERAAKGDVETLTSAAGFLFRMWSPFGAEDDNPFAMAVEKQGKVYLNVPKPTVERYPDDGGVSVEANILGALKLYLGGSNKNNTSLQAFLAGGIRAEIGHNKDTGNAIDVIYHSGVAATYKSGVGNEEGYAKFEDVQGNMGVGVSGDMNESVQGAKNTTVSGGYVIQADRHNINAFQGLGLNVGQLDVLVAQKSQYQYALAVLETVVAGGKVSTILAGGLVENVAAGGAALNVAAGGVLHTVGGGGYGINVGAGGMTVTVGAGAVAITAGAGAIALTAGAAITLSASLAITLTAAASIMLTAPLVQLGGPTAVLGVCRGVPSLPPGAPTLDIITNIPLLGALTVLSNLCPFFRLPSP